MAVSKGGVASRQIAASRRSWWRDGLEAAVWFVAATGVALGIADGALSVSGSAEWMRGSARLLGIVAAVLMMTQVLLASRAPWIERVVGHDRSVALHARLGPYAILLMGCHLALIAASTSAVSGLGFLESIRELGQSAPVFAASILAAILFGLVLITSLWAGLRRWHYESWHTVHRATYLAIALAIPHQFLEGSTFRDGGPAWWFWLTLYMVTFGSFVAFRMARPVVLAIRNRGTVTRVVGNADGSTTVEIAVRGADRLRARAGQFFLWRFWAPHLLWEKHPYSLSAAPSAKGFRITVKPSGGGSRAVARLQPGTRVSFEGPLGVFSHAVREGSRLVLVAAGIGITPIRAMLDEVKIGDDCTVVVRAPSRAEAPLIDEVEALASAKGAELIELYGPRGDAWAPREFSGTLAELVGDLRDADVFVCGPVTWAKAVEDDAVASGASRAAVHRERFGW